MLGLFLLYFIGKAYYDLAEKHTRKKWLHAFLGIASYYAGTILGGVVIVILYGAMESEQAVDQMNDIVVSLLSVPFGILSCWLVYYMLKRKWEDDIVSTN